MIAKDNHNHIILSSLDSMVRAARAKEIEQFSVTEHVSQFRKPRDSINFGSVHRSGRIFQSLKEYQSEFENLNTEDDKFAVRKGLEVDYSPRYEKAVGEYVSGEEWDILLCSVHELEDQSDVQAPIPSRDPKRWRDYIKLERMALESDFIPFDVLTHPVRMIMGNSNLPQDMDELLLDLAKVARSSDVALELNGSDLSYAPDLVRRLALACSKASCAVSLGSDAHYPKDVFRKMKSAEELVKEFKLSVL